MDMISATFKQQPQYFSHQDQIHCVSDCLLMARAIKRHNEDAALMLSSSEALTRVDEMNQIIDGAGGLLVALEGESTLNNFQTDELTMVWNKLSYLVMKTYQGPYFQSSNIINH